MAQQIQRPQAILTGASRGIGLEVCRGPIAAGRDVIALARQITPELLALQTEAQAAETSLKFATVDLASMRSIREFAAVCLASTTPVNLLIHNAAVVTPKRGETVDGFERQFAVNHLAVVLLTHELWPLLRRADSTRIVVTSSQIERHGAIDFDDLQGLRTYDAERAYCQSKLCNVLFTRELHRRMRAGPRHYPGITVNCLHPGVVRTSLLNTLLDQSAQRRASESWISRLYARLRRSAGTVLRHAGLLLPVQDWALTPAAGAQATLFLALASEVRGISGEYFLEQSVAQGSERSRDENTARRLWNESAAMLGLDNNWPN
jgi:NAD(P)-dependent dehydrogenase (short-subunit alcohol dehydrogenase family)